MMWNFPFGATEEEYEIMLKLSIFLTFCKIGYFEVILLKNYNPTNKQAPGYRKDHSFW